MKFETNKKIDGVNQEPIKLVLAMLTGAGGRAFTTIG